MIVRAKIRKFILTFLVLFIAIQAAIASGAVVDTAWSVPASGTGSLNTVSFATSSSGGGSSSSLVATDTGIANPTGLRIAYTSIYTGASNSVYWTMVPGATQYRVYLYKQNADGTYTNVLIAGSSYKSVGNTYGLAPCSNVTSVAGTYKFLVVAGNAGGFTHPGTYSPAFVVVPAPKGPTYVDVNLSTQTLTYYVDGVVKLTTPVVTGRPSMPTVQGTFAIYAMSRNTYLDGPGYHTLVSYWMPFYKGYGLHDATWQSAFGGTRYRDGYGSHGCVNMPLDKAAQLYGMVSVGTTVVVHT